ncbi:type II toxin-antitoxin system RelE/ParE family toxin [Microbaculum marinum]|uniref:Type II toxin-antitoxin system RelE/ParE family toxin n=1 Tax=Microbaculum marinum TaxID=1764581 RepID=A0AAW9RN87_9HYPH
MRVVEYLDPHGRSPFARWFGTLNARAAARIAVTLARMGQGNLSGAKSVGGGVLECRLDYGPGYRVYFGRDGAELVILLAGGTKRRQQADIVRARERWRDCRQRKKEI